jgi:hypothetical protein
MPAPMDEYKYELRNCLQSRILKNYPHEKRSPFDAVAEARSAVQEETPVAPAGDPGSLLFLRFLESVLELTLVGSSVKVAA